MKEQGRDTQMTKLYDLQWHKLTIWFFIFLVACTQAEDLDYGECTGPLGLENGLITDDLLRASSSNSSRLAQPQFGRLNNDQGEWCHGGKNREEYLHIELHYKIHKITALAVQGRFKEGHGIEFAKQYSLRIYKSKKKGWEDRSISDSTYEPCDNGIVKIILRHPIYALAVRIKFRRNVNDAACLRAELYGCLPDLLAYNVPQGDIDDFGVKYTDWTYDGDEKGGMLTGGLGLLVDGSTNEMVGWKKNELHQGEVGHFQILFKFSSVQQFRAVEVYFKEGVAPSDQTFCRLVMSVSMHGFSYSEVAKYERLSDGILLEPGHLKLQLQQPVGQYIKFQLYFLDSPWILISEIKFHSQYPGNSQEVTTAYDVKNDTNQTNVDGKIRENKANKHAMRNLICILSLFAGIVAFLTIVVAIIVCLHCLKKRKKISAPQQRENTAQKNSLYNFQGLIHDCESYAKDAQNEKRSVQRSKINNRY